MKKNQSVKIEMLSTGDEVLYGQIIDTNSAWLSDYLFQQGFLMTSRVTAGDNLQQLIAMLKERSLHNDILIVNGGLGPTSDDLSALAAAMANNEELVEQHEWLLEMERYFAERGREMSPSNRKQAMIPKSATMINNPVGTACGFMMKLNDCILFFSPGVPSEFKVMVKDEIVPRMRQYYPDVTVPLCYRLTTLGRSESDIATELESNLKLPEGVSLGYRSAMPIIELKLTGPETKQPEMDKIWQQLKQYVQENTIFEGTVGLPSLVGSLLKEQQLSLAVVEQYSAGLMAYQLYEAQAPLVKSVVVNDLIPDLAAYGQQILTESNTDIVLLMGNYQDQDNAFEVALVTKNKTHHFSMKYTSRKHNRPTQQDIFASVVLDILRRYLLGQSLIGPNIWLDVKEM